MSATGQQTPVPDSFLGLSTEYYTLPYDGRHIAIYGRVLSMLHVPGDAPFVLRIGGDSSQETFYTGHARRGPRWTVDLTNRFVERTARVVRALHLRAIIDLDVITAVPRLLEAGVEEAQRVFSPGSVIGYEIGNEPDLYHHGEWRRLIRGTVLRRVRLPRRITPQRYATDFDNYARVLSELAPGVPLMGPALANQGRQRAWIGTLLSSPHPGLQVITVHRYPYLACVPPTSQAYPTIGRILSNRATLHVAQSVRPVVKLADAAGMSVRLTEINSVSCGGLRGVSNTFATALWAPEALFDLVRAGVIGVNLHARQNTINGPFWFGARGVVARPLLYGLALFTRALGPDASLLRVSAARGSSALETWAIAVAGRQLHVLMIDRSDRPVSARLALPASGAAVVQRLLAPSVASSSGVTLAGQSIDSDGRWSGHFKSVTVVPHDHRYTVRLQPYTAALLSVPLAVSG